MNTDERKDGAEAAPSGMAARAVTGLVRFGGLLSTLLILLTFLIVVVAVTRRYVMGVPLLWGDQLIGYLLVAIVMFGAAEALRRGDHIAIDLLTSRAGRGVRRAQALFSSLAVLVFSAVLGVSTWESIAFARSFGSYSVGYIEIETWIPQVPVLIGALLLGLMACADLLRAATERPA